MREFGDDLAGEVAVHDHPHSVVIERAERPEGEVGDRTEVLVGQLADVGDVAAGRARDELAVTDRTVALRVEHDRHFAV